MRRFRTGKQLTYHVGYVGVYCRFLGGRDVGDTTDDLRGDGFEYGGRISLSVSLVEIMQAYVVVESLADQAEAPATQHRERLPNVPYVTLNSPVENLTIGGGDVAI